MSSIITEPPEVEIYYPEGPQMPEGDLQTRRRMELLWTLRRWFDRRGDDSGAGCPVASTSTRAEYAGLGDTPDEPDR